MHFLHREFQKQPTRPTIKGRGHQGYVGSKIEEIFSRFPPSRHKEARGTIRLGIRWLILSVLIDFRSAHEQLCGERKAYPAPPVFNNSIRQSVELTYALYR